MARSTRRRLPRIASVLYVFLIASARCHLFAYQYTMCLANREPEREREREREREESLACNSNRLKWPCRVPSVARHRRVDVVVVVVVVIVVVGPEAPANAWR